MKKTYSITKYYACYQGMHLLIYIKPYAPLKPCNANTAFVDSYYKAYQELYFFKKREKSELEANGIVCENIFPDVPYKDLMVNLGIGVRLKNQLVYIDGIGTFFAVEVLKTSVAVTENANSELPKTAFYPCEGCEKCARACPVGALDGQGGYRRARCIRQLQESPLEEACTCKEAIGNRVLGCNNCQLVCPVNAQFEPVEYTAEEKEKFLLANFLQQSYNGKEAWAWYEAYVGKNFARKTKFRSFIENALELAKGKQP